MGKKNKKAKSAVADSEAGMPRHLRREILTIANELLESKLQFWVLESFQSLFCVGNCY